MDNILPFTPSNSTILRPMALGRRGVRVANMPCSTSCKKRFDHQFWRTGTMQMVYEIKMGKAFDIFEAGGIGWKYFQYSLTVLCEYGLCRCLLCNGVFAVDDTDRRIGNGLRYRTGLTFFFLSWCYVPGKIMRILHRAAIFSIRKTGMIRTGRLVGKRYFLPICG